MWPQPSLCTVRYNESNGDFCTNTSEASVLAGPFFSLRTHPDAICATKSDRFPLIHEQQIKFLSNRTAHFTIQCDNGPRAQFMLGVFFLLVTFWILVIGKCMTFYVAQGRARQQYTNIVQGIVQVDDIVEQDEILPLPPQANPDDEKSR